MFLVDMLSGLLRPARCLGCGAPGEWPCCARCLPPGPADVGPWSLAADPEVTLWALGPYRDALRSALLAGKFDGQPAALTELGHRLGTALAEAGVGADLVTYVAAARVTGPPRDHAERIATGIATALDLPLVPLLTPAPGPDLGQSRRTRSPSSGSIPTRITPGDDDLPFRWVAVGDDGHSSRWGVFGDGARRSRQLPSSRPPPAARRRLAGGRILLVDDLATTGGTLAGAAATLNLAGARQVEAAVLAAAPSALRVEPAHPSSRLRTPGLGPRDPGPATSLTHPRPPIPRPSPARPPATRPRPRDPPPSRPSRLARPAAARPRWPGA